MSDPKPFASLSSSLLARKGGATPAMRRQNYNAPIDHEALNHDLGWNDMGEDDAENGNGAEYASLSNYKENPLQGAIPEAGPSVREQQEEIAAKLSADPDVTDAVDDGYEETGEFAEEEFEANPVEDQGQAPRKSDALGNTLTLSTDIPTAEFQAEEAWAEPEHSETDNRVVELPQVNVDFEKLPVVKESAGRKAAFTLRLDPERHLRLRLAATVEHMSAQRLVTKALDKYLSNIPELDDLAERIPQRNAG